jgi:hypothetical protein
MDGIRKNGTATKLRASATKNVLNAEKFSIYSEVKI